VRSRSRWLRNIRSLGGHHRGRRAAGVFRCSPMPPPELREAAAKQMWWHVRVDVCERRRSQSQKSYMGTSARTSPELVEPVAETPGAQRSQGHGGG
jgi:hypothetical protein